MIFVDANVFMYFVGADHPLRKEARDFFIRSRKRDRPLVTSAEVLQELLHHYLRRDRRPLLDAAFDLVGSTVDEVWPVEEADVPHSDDSDHPFRRTDHRFRRIPITLGDQRSIGALGVGLRV